MRELEFLPDWYPHLRRHRRLIALQVWGALALAAAVALWLALASRNVAAARQTLQTLSDSLAHTDGQLHQLDEQLALERQQVQQIQVLEKLEPHVEAARLLRQLEDLMPPEMGLSELSFQVTEEPARAADLLAAAADRKARAFDRRLRVRLQGVAPTDVDLANFLSRLAAVPFFDQVAMTYARDRSDSGHVMREFELTFCVPLGTAQTN